jgi:hypothetical protein
MQIVGARLGGAFVTTTATYLLGVSRETVSNVMLSYTNHGKTTSAKRNGGQKSTFDRKRSYIGKDCSEKSHNYCTQVTAELNIHLKDLASTKTVRCQLYKSNIHGRTAIAKAQITESNGEMRKRWGHNHITWTLDNWKSAHERSLQSGMPGSNSETRGSCNIVVQYSVGSSITLHGRITARKYVDRLGNQVHAMFYTLFPNDTVFQDSMPPFTQLELFSRGLKSMKMNFNILPGQHNHQI